jgi:signal transduction histidine kinase
MDVAVPVPLRRPRRLDVAIVAIAGLLLLGSLALWFAPGLETVYHAPELDMAINVAATLVGAAIAILAWVRWRETADPAALYVSGAFVTLMMTNAVIVGLVLAGETASFGLDAASPGVTPVYLWAMARLTAAVLLVAGAYHGLRRSVLRLPPLVVAVVPIVLLFAGALIVRTAEGRLGIIRSLADTSPQSAASVALAAMQLISFAAYLLAAALFRRLHIRDGTVSYAYLAVALVIAAFSQLHFAVDPIVAFGIVTSGDVLRLAFHGVLFFGIEAQIQSDIVAVRRANTELRRLREVDSANAALAERGRLAREIHDGLAQDLWYAKLKQERLAQAPELGEDARRTAGEVMAALDSALAEARQAVMAMRTDPAAASTLEDVLRDYVEDFGDRFGVQTEFDVDGSGRRLRPRTEAEILRIVQEALNNVRKHADATLARVHVEHRPDWIRIAVVDNGRGFDLDRVGGDGFGLRSMRERADLVGANFEITTRPSDGTRVEVRLPLPEHD